eukprot:5857907-Amphidinium_carterae.2
MAQMCAACMSSSVFTVSLSGPELQDGPSVLLIHGLFVNADHWRRNMPALAAAGFRVFSLDLVGYGYSSKPSPYGDVAKAFNGEAD